MSVQSDTNEQYAVVQEDEMTTLKRKVLELEMENYKLEKYRNLYTASEQSRQTLTHKVGFLETELAKCGKDVSALQNVVDESAKIEVKTMEEVIDNMVFIVPVEKLGKRIFAKEKVYFKFNGWNGQLEAMFNDTELLE